MTCPPEVEDFRRQEALGEEASEGILNFFNSNPNNKYQE